MLHEQGQRPQPAVNDDYHDSPTTTRRYIDWELVLRVMISLVAGLSLIWCFISPIRFIHAEKDVFLFLAVQDIPLMGVAFSMAYTTLFFNGTHRNLSTVTAIAAMVCALVI